ncbi:actin-regulating kinase PRK1-like isoform X2 [Chenopodium quinoa]|uniref:actin-regulating kinase PRK1-like isoform X2 n=1 Tax=Chenopodium quinoa TaxID=63459 RepID=UPI000B7747CE|nr:actin-regulating kinase PRK1-like isoform X2 [Chenopodium quinoa]
MFTNDKRQAERTGKYGTPRPQHLQQLITQFQNSTISNESKEKIVANLANFSYDPYNYAILRDLNVLELFIDCLTEPNERLIEFAVGGICNAVADPQNAQIVCDCGGVAALIDCLSSPVRNTVKLCWTRFRKHEFHVEEWAAEHCSAPFRAPELWDCPSQCNIDERTDIWSLGCTLYAIMYGVSPFEYALGESGGSLQLAIVNVQIKWPAGPKPPYPDTLHQFVTWMLQPQAAVRPRIDDIIIHVDKLISKYSD